MKGLLDTQGIELGSEGPGERESRSSIEPSARSEYSLLRGGVVAFGSAVHAGSTAGRDFVVWSVPAPERAADGQPASERRARGDSGGLRQLRAMAERLAKASSAADVGAVAIEHCTAALGARRGALHVLESEPRGALADVLRGGAPRLFDGADDLRRCCAECAHGPLFADATAAIVLVPLLGKPAPVGYLLLSFADTGDFLEQDPHLVALLALQCAEALQRALLAERDRRYHERVRILAEAGDLLASSLEYEPTLRAIVRLATPELADFCILEVIGEDGRRRICKAREGAPMLEPLERAPLPLGMAGGEPETIFCPDLEGPREAGGNLDLGLREALRECAVCSIIALPLLSCGELLGTLAFCHGPSRRRHTASDLALGEELALRAAQAIRQAELYRASQRATRRAEAAALQVEEAMRLKDEFLTTVSHELRTPLSAILGWSVLLRRERRTIAGSLEKGLEVIERNARAQQRMIEDLLDVSSIVSGRLRLNSAAVKLETLADDVMSSLCWAAAARGVKFVLSAPGGPHWVQGDPDRLRQILWNLLSNAVKFTPSGGTVRLEIAREPDAVSVVVRDTGAGIAPEFLPFVFERFRQADGTTTRAHGGLGLGLSMVRYLTEMHGGTVSAESPGAGKGATFVVRLPLGPSERP